MKKQYIAWCAAEMPYLIDNYIIAATRYKNDLARAARIESDMLVLSNKGLELAQNFLGFNANDLIIELRDDKHVKERLSDIAWRWKNTPITKTQRALLGVDAMHQIKTIYKTL